MSTPAPDTCNEELAVQGLVDLIDARFVAAFGAGRGCSRGVPASVQMPEETPYAWLAQGETYFQPCDNGYPLGATEIGIAVRVCPTQADQGAADVAGQRAVWTMINRAKWILDQLLVPAHHQLNSIDAVILPNGKPNRYWGEDEAWLSYPLRLEFPTGMPSA
jgi:hypothetical protein